MGELLTEMPKNDGGRPEQNQSYHATGFSDAPKPSAPTPVATLADLGISRDLSSRCQKIASLPEEVFEDYIESAADGKHELTTAGALKIAKSEELKAAKVGVSGKTVDEAEKIEKPAPAPARAFLRPPRP